MTITVLDRAAVIGTADPNPWSPGPGYLALTVTAWARPHVRGFEVVVLTSVTPDRGVPALACGIVEAGFMLLADTWVDDPTVLSELAAMSVLDLQEIGPDHPVLAHLDDHVAEFGCGICVDAWIALGLDPDMLADHDPEEPPANAAA